MIPFNAFSFHWHRGVAGKIKNLLIGNPKNFNDKSIFKSMALIPLLAWIGLGADGLSSSAYGPEEAFRMLGAHTYLAVGLAVLTAITVIIISLAYSGIIEEFPHGGGGYVVSTKLLGKPAGVLSGSALLIDYVLTITVSIASAGDAIFSFLPKEWVLYKFPVEICFLIFLIVLNIRGVKESILILAPIFIMFIILHLILIVGSISIKLPELASLSAKLNVGFHEGLTTLGALGMFLLFAHAFSLGGGTYTGIEAVSNSMDVMREPKVNTAKKTMFYMALSLSFTAAGLILCYLLWNVGFVEGKTLNAVLAESFFGTRLSGKTFVILTLISEGALLIVAAQAGFIAGPRILANMAIDSWVPRQFASLSQRLTTQRGIIFMGVVSLLALIGTYGSVRTLVIMYSINVFLTFSLSILGMFLLWVKRRKTHKHWKNHCLIFLTALILCVTILLMTVIEKFFEGGWVTLLITLLLFILCFRIRRHYRRIGITLAHAYADQKHAFNKKLPGQKFKGEIDKSLPTAVFLVADYSAVGIKTVWSTLYKYPDLFKNVVFISVGIIDSGEFKGIDSIEALKERTKSALKKYVELAQRMEYPGTFKYSISTDVVNESEKLCVEVAEEFKNTTFFIGMLEFREEKWYHRFLHNDVANHLTKKLLRQGYNINIVPIPF